MLASCSSRVHSRITCKLSYAVKRGTDLTVLHSNTDVISYSARGTQSGNAAIFRATYNAGSVRCHPSNATSAHALRSDLGAWQGPDQFTWRPPSSVRGGESACGGQDGLVRSNGVGSAVYRCGQEYSRAGAALPIPSHVQHLSWVQPSRCAPVEGNLSFSCRVAYGLGDTWAQS